MTVYTQRVKVGATYTDGETIWEVTSVYDTGAVSLTADDGRTRGIGIDAFRRKFWLVTEGTDLEPTTDEGGDDE